MAEEHQLAVPESPSNNNNKENTDTAQNLPTTKKLDSDGPTMTKKKSPQKSSPAAKAPTPVADVNMEETVSESKENPEEAQDDSTAAPPSEDRKRKHEETETTNSPDDEQKLPAVEDDHKEPGSSSSEQKLPPLDITKPIKRARTAYFIFCDDRRGELKSKHKSVAGVAKELGQMWSQLSAEEKEVYTNKAAEERERVAKQLEQFKAAGGDISKLPGAATMNNSDNKGSQHLILPLTKIRKICRLDPDVRTLSKEAMMLITKCAELATSKLGIESVRVAQIQNRRTLLPEDVAQVCATREQFLFLRDDVKDLVREQLKQKEATANGSKTSAAADAASSKSRPLTSYFAKQS